MRSPSCGATRSNPWAESASNAHGSDCGGIPGDRVLYVVDGRGEILSARTKPRLLGHRATLDRDGEVLVDGMPWRSAEVAAAVRAAAGPGCAARPGRRPRALRHPPAARRHRRSDQSIRLRPAPTTAQHRHLRSRRTGGAPLGMEPARSRRRRHRARRPTRPVHHHDLASGHPHPRRRCPATHPQSTSTAPSPSTPGPAARDTSLSATRPKPSTSQSSSQSPSQGASRDRTQQAVQLESG